MPNDTEQADMLRAANVARIEKHGVLIVICEGCAARVALANRRGSYSCGTCGNEIVIEQPRPKAKVK
jgi:predicted RNA-binding Zn-ribbon protein involved in translation (DUF1610 family)